MREKPHELSSLFLPWQPRVPPGRSPPRIENSLHGGLKIQATSPPEAEVHLELASQRSFGAGGQKIRAREGTLNKRGSRRQKPSPRSRLHWELYCRWGCNIRWAAKEPPSRNQVFKHWGGTKAGRTALFD